MLVQLQLYIVSCNYYYYFWVSTLDHCYKLTLDPRCVVPIKANILGTNIVLQRKSSYIRTKLYLLILLLNFDRHVQRPANEKETLVAVRAVEADVTSVPPVVMQTTTPTSTNIIERMLEPESRETTEISHDVGILSTGNQDANYSQVYTLDDAPSSAEKIRLDEAATVAQAAFKGYLVFFLLFY